MSDKERTVEHLKNIIKMYEDGDIEIIELSLKRDEPEQEFYNYRVYLPSPYFTLSIFYKDNRK